MNLTRFKNAFTALKYPNYRLWFKGQIVSLFGTWMQMTAQGFLIFELTHSSAYLGIMGFAAGIPSWLFMMYGGVIADRLPRRLLLILTQTSMMIFALVLAALTFLDVVQPWHIIVFAFCLGIATAFDAPARQAFVLEMVEREDLTNAIALNSTMFNSATAIGPAVGGVVYAVFGPAWCFTINGLTFIAVIIALMKMKLKPQPKPERRNSVITDLKEGMKYVIHEPITRIIIVTVGVVMLTGFSFATLMPAWAVKILHGDATTNGILQSARGVGALLGALFIAVLGRFKYKGKIFTIGTFAFPLFLIIFAFLRVEIFSLLALIGVGITIMFIFNMANALIQSIVPDKLRGRVMGIYSLSFFGMMPIGALWIGFFAEHSSEPLAVIVNAVILFIFSFIVWLYVPKLKAQE
ncbi:MAG: MFS transporter [Ignavibacteria bacterium RBG_13_36_8]|nr:MAG: MFS transporter [Ignavibacteria bacterium RBG_13_36_8]